MDDLYSPYTGEHIPTDSPASWMLRAGVAAPEYDRSTQGCFWRSYGWEIVAGGQTISVYDVEAERDRRLAAASFDYDFGDDRGVHTIGTDEKDMAAWMMEVMPIAQARLALSDSTAINIVTNTGPVSVSPTEWMDIINTGAASRQAIWQYYFALIAMDPIPADYQDDQYWSPSE